MITAFQDDAFQDDAFQIYGGYSDVYAIAPRKKEEDDDDYLFLAAWFMFMR